MDRPDRNAVTKFASGTNRAEAAREASRLVTNGVWADRGELLGDGVPLNRVFECARDNVLRRDRREAQGLQRVIGNEQDRRLGFTEGVIESSADRANLAITGWAVIFPRVEPNTPAEKRQAGIREALEPLLQRRRELAGEALYKDLHGSRGYGPPQQDGRVPFRDWCTRFMRVDPAVPCRPLDFPYYVLLVGTPDEIPFEFQYQLDVVYGVGRLDLGDDLDAYANYARNVVAVETDGAGRPRDMAFWAPLNPGDRGATKLSLEQLMLPLDGSLLFESSVRAPSWTRRRFYEEKATHGQLESVLGRGRTPSILFTAGHGAAFSDFDQMERRAGALVTASWPGHGSGPLAEEMLFAADHVPSAADVRGLILFNFACFGGGTPRADEFGIGLGSSKGAQIAKYPMVSPLHRRLLSLDKGALAGIGHVERAWTYQLPESDGRLRNRLEPFKSVVEVLMKGLPVGAATEVLNQRYAALGAQLAERLDEVDGGERDPYEFLQDWADYHDVRNYVVNGDPAVRLPLAPVRGDNRPGRGGRAVTGAFADAATV